MPLTRRWTETAAGTMHACAGGQWARGSAVVLVHGLVISSRYMVPTALELAPLCAVYAVDLPGYGDSVKPRTILGLTELADALAAWMDAVNVASAHLIGNSVGCQILAEFALRHPDRVNRLVFQGPTIDASARTVRQQLARLVNNSAREGPGPGWITLVDYVKAGLPRVRATIRMAMQDRIEDTLPGIVQPTLVVRGGRDPSCPSDGPKRSLACFRRESYECCPAWAIRSTTRPPKNSWPPCGRSCICKVPFWPRIQTISRISTRPPAWSARWPPT
jgi:2-hydroxy-6-oxonona-2,4-dienedioate hydrolase